MNTNQDFVRLLGAVRDHLALAEPAGEVVSVQVAINSLDGELVIVHLRGASLAELAAALLGWADTLTAVTVTLWRPPEGDRVHLDMTGQLVDEAVQVYGGVLFDPEIFGTDRRPGDRWDIPLGVLRGWAA